MTTQTEALNIAIDYMNERLEDHDCKYQRHPATEAERINILADIETVKEALNRGAMDSSANGEAQPKRTWEGLSIFEIDELVYETEYDDYYDLVKRTEALLEEKNNVSR